MAGMSDLVHQLMEGQAIQAIATLQNLKQFDNSNIEEIKNAMKTIDGIMDNAFLKTPEYISGVIILNKDLYEFESAIRTIFMHALKYANNSIEAHDFSISMNKSMVETNTEAFKLIECADPEKLLKAFKKE